MTVTYTGTNGFPNRTQQYVGELVFEGTTLKEIRHEYGRVLADADFRYQYYLTDHLGNTRVVLQEDPAHFTVSATFEPDNLETESMQFMDYGEAPHIASSLFDHTGTSETGYALRLTNGETGPSRSVAVLPGDTVRMEVFGKYLDLQNEKTDPALMMLSLAIEAANPGNLGIDGNLSTPSSRIAGTDQGLAGLLIGKESRSDAPPAYLNYLFFDKEMNYKYGGYVQMTEAAYEDGSNREHERLYSEVVAEEPGYFYIYLSNDGTEGGEAFFDDFTILTLESYIVQQTDYYPYGLIARNFVRAGEKETMELFQGKTYDELTGWYDFHARQYDAALGRWFGVDPQNQFASPFVGMGNNPVMMVDPDGELAFMAAAFFAKKAIVALKAAKVAKVAVAGTKTAKASKFASVIGKATSTKGLKTGLKSGAINTISNYDSKEGFGWNTLGDFAAGFGGGAFGFGTENKLVGMGVGGLATWGVNGASLDYEGAQEFVGGALSTFVGMNGAVKGKHALFKQSEGVKTLAKFDNSNLITNTLKKHGDNFLKYGLQNNAYDFAYSKEKDFRYRGWGHLDLFLWGGFSGAYQQNSFSLAGEEPVFNRFPFGARMEYQAIDWAINGWIKKRYDGFKVDGNKAFVSYLKWNLWFYGL